MQIVSTRNVDLALTLTAALWLLVVVGCKQQVAVVPVERISMAESSTEEHTTSGDFEFSEVELSDPKVNVDVNGICWFEVKYRIVKGAIGENYLLSVAFPGTENACVKQISGWQLEGAEGTIKDGFPLLQKPISEYEFVLSEAEVPQNGYTKISNVLTGNTK